MLEYINQELACNDPVHINTCPLILCQALLLLHHNQRPCLHLAHLHTGFGNLIDGLIRKSALHRIFPHIKGQEGTDNILSAKFIHCFAQLRLQDYYHCDHPYAQQVIYNPEYGIHFKISGNQKKHCYENNTLQQ